MQKKTAKTHGLVLYLVHTRRNNQILNQVVKDNNQKFFSLSMFHSVYSYELYQFYFRRWFISDFMHVLIVCIFMLRFGGGVDRQIRIVARVYFGVMLCRNGCGRWAAVGYPTCCRSCTASGATTHGPICQALAAGCEAPPAAAGSSGGALPYQPKTLLKH